MSSAPLSPSPDARAGGDASDLDRLRALARRRLRSRGLDGAGVDRRGERTLDPCPVVIDARRWRALESAVVRRVALAEAVLDDVYAAAPRLVGSVLPPEIVYGSPAFMPAAAGWAPAGGRRVVLAAIDARPDGAGWTLDGVHLGVPAGLGVAIENREITAELRSADFGAGRVRRLAPFLTTMRQVVAGLTPPGAAEARVVLVSPGRGDPTHADVGELARTLGYTLAEGADLAVRHGHVFLRSLAGLEPVPVLLRFVPDHLADPVELDPGSMLGTPGLVSAARRGAVALANPLGGAWVGVGALGAFWDGVAQVVLGEHSDGGSRDDAGVPRWCGWDDHRRWALSRLDELEWRTLDPAAPPIDGRALAVTEADDLRRRVEARPWWWSAAHPLAAGAGEAAGDVVVRLFAVAGPDGIAVMPGGLATVAGEAATTADVWVSAPSGGDRPAELAPRLAHLGQVDFGTSLPSRAGEALFWFGRYIERAEALLRLGRAVLDLAEQLPPEALSDGHPGGDALAGGSQAGAAQDALDHFSASGATTLAALAAAADRLAGSHPSGAPATVAALDALTDAARPAGLPATAGRVVSSAAAVRELLSPDLWVGIDRFRRGVERLAADASNRRRIDASGHEALLALSRVEELAEARDDLDQLLGALSAVAGVIHESTLRGPGWHLLDAGRRIERCLATVALLDAALAGPQPASVELLEALLRAQVSLIAYRRRHRSDLELDAVLAILVLDASNPRSVRWSLDALIADLAQLPPPARSGASRATVVRAREVLALLDRLDPGALTAGSTGVGLRETLERVRSAVSDVAKAISDDYLRHIWVAQLPTGTLGARSVAEQRGRA